MGCQVCNSALLTSCSQCSPGYLLSTNNTCIMSTSCPAKCASCSDAGCGGCLSGYFLNQNQECQEECVLPCATCSSTNASFCLSCLEGYSLSGISCLANTTCSVSQTCVVCPLGYTLVNTTTTSQISQVCLLCESSSNCARCSASNSSQCTSCPSGTYLNGTICLSCSLGCAVCIGLNSCTECSDGYLPSQSGSVSGNSGSGLLTCVACAPPCGNCLGSTITCASCPNGFTLVGEVCLSQFHYLIQVSFDTTLSIFETNYFTFLSQVTTAVGVKLSDMVVTSIVSGSVTVGM